MKCFVCNPKFGVLFIIVVAILTALSSQSQTMFTVEVKGKGSPMIFIPGLTCTGDVWNETVTHYQNHYECHVLTLAGFGSNAPVTREKFLASVKDDLIAYIQKKQLNAPVIIGHSLGGFLALWVASEYKGKLGKVISVDGYPFVAAMIMPDATPETAKSMATNMSQGWNVQSQDEYALRTKMSLAMMITDPKKIDMVMESAKLSDVKTQGQAMYEMMTTDLRPQISQISCPVLVLGSWIAYKDYGQTHDGAVLGLQKQTSAIKQVTIDVTDTARHFIFFDDPAWFFAKTDTFLR